MLLLVLVLTTASLLAAAAYNTATVTNAATLKVSTTDDSLLALSPQAGHVGTNPFGWNTPYLNVGNKDGTARIDDGELAIDFSRGAGGYSTPDPGSGNHGVQPNSVYIWDNLFMVRNKTSETIDCEIAVSLTSLPAGVEVWMKDHNSATWLLVSSGAKVLKELAARNSADTDELYVDAKIVVSSSVSASTAIDYAGTMVVKGTAK